MSSVGSENTSTLGGSIQNISDTSIVKLENHGQGYTASQMDDILSSKVMN